MAIRKSTLVVLALAGSFAPRLVGQELPTEIDADRVVHPRTGGDVVIRNATVHPLTGPAVGRTSILVRDGRIAAIFPHDGDGPAVAPGTFEIDGFGLHVTPGIIDCHSHIAIAGGINESASSITAEVRIDEEVNGDDLSIYRALAGGCTTANLLHGSANAIGGQNAVIKLKYRRPASELLFPGAPRGIKFALGENPKRSSSQGGGGRRDEPSRYPVTRMGVEAVIRRALIEAREYRAEWDRYEAARKVGDDPEPPRRDLRLETLAGVLSSDVLVHSHCYRNDEILMLMRLAEEFGFRIATFQHVLEGYKVAPEIARHGAGGSTFSDWWAYKAEAYDAIPYNAALMRRAGVVVSLNSDSSELMRRLNLEAAKAVKYGVDDEVEALAMVTRNPAQQLRIDDRVGTIEVGKDADLAIWNGHPLSSYSRCEWTLVDGEVEFLRAGRPTALDAPIGPPATDPEGDATTSIDAAPVARDVRSDDRGAPSFAIVDGTIVPASGPPIERGVVLVRAGRIEAVGRDVAVPSDYRRVDASRRFVYPGMIDASTQLGLTEIGSVPGTIDVREQGSHQADLRVALAIDPSSELVPVARVNGITSAVVRPRGGLISGQSALVRLSGWTWEEMTRVDPLALHVNPPGAARRSRFRGRSAEPSDGGEDERTRELITAFERAAAYGEQKRRAAAQGVPGPALDPRLEAMLPYAEQARPVIFDADDEKAIRKVIELAARLKVRPIISGGREAWKVAGLLAKHDVPVLLGSILSNPTEPHDPYDAPFASAAVLYRAGVRFCFQTNDASNVRNLPYEAAMSAAFGLPKEEALRAVTLRPAEILGVDRDLGSIEPGKIADLVVTDGDLLEIRTRVVGLYIGGREVPLDSAHTRRYEEYAQRLTATGPAGASAGGR